MNRLPHRALGNTGLSVSCLGLGTVKFGRNQGVKYPSGFELPDDMELRQVLDVARELGINLLDTAPAYGISEQRVGRLLSDRHDWVLCSKVGEEFENGRSFFDFSASHVRASLERSLRRLNTDHLDLVLIHSDGNDRGIIEQGECLETLQRCREEGLVRAIGMSSKTVEGGLMALPHCDVLMLSYNPAETATAPVIDRARELGRGVLIKKALNSGHGLDSTSGVDPVERNMAFILGHPGVSSVIVGSINPVHMRHNARAAIRALGL